MHDSTNCPICRGLPTGDSMTDEQFATFLEACREELARKQVLFQERTLDAARWSYDLDVGMITIGSESFPITAIGTHSPEYETWLWSWANNDNPASARNASKRLQALYEVTGFCVFTDPGIGASSLDAQDFAALAIHQLGAIGMFRCPSKGGPTLYLAVHEPDERS